MNIKNCLGQDDRYSGNCRGFTLIEVLISTTIMAMLIFLATLSFSMFLNLWGESRLTDIKAVTRYRGHILLRSSLESIFDYYVTDPANEKKKIYYPYFVGRKDVCEFVTYSSVFRRGMPAVARLRLTGGQDAASGRRLVYEEVPLNDYYLRYGDFQTEFTNSLILDTGVKELKIRYFGFWEFVWQPDSENFIRLSKWQSTFSGKEKKTVPEKLEITVITGEGDEIFLYEVRAKNIFKQVFFRPQG